nr:hypothetical protein [Tanacetum cinerariifolium]
MNYKPVVTSNQSNGNAGTKACEDAGKARMETIPGKDYILLILWTADPLISQESKSSQDNGFQPLSDDRKKVEEDPRQEINVVGANTNNELPFDPEMLELKDISTINFSNKDEDDDAEADMNNLDTIIQVSPTPTTKVHKDHPLDQVIDDLHSTTQTKNMSKNFSNEEHGFVTTIHQRTNHKNLQIIYLLVFYHKKNPKRNKKDERGIVIRNKARIEAIRLFLAYASFKDFVVYQMGVKSAFLYENIEEVVYAYQPPGFEDPYFPDKVYKVEKALYGLHQAPRAWIFRYLKGHHKLGLWYPKDSPFDLVAYTDSDYAGASLDRKSTTRGNARKSMKNKTNKSVFVRKRIERVGENKKERELCTENRKSDLVSKRNERNVISEASIRRDLKFGDEEGVDCLPNEVIFEKLTLIGAKTTAWNKFSNSITSTVICLATYQKYNFSKYIFESMVKNLDSVTKFLMYP